MAVLYHNDLKITRMNAVQSAIDGGSGPGTLEMCTEDYAIVLLVFTFSDVCGTVAGDPATLTFSGMPKHATGLANGAVAVARTKDAAGKIIISGLTVGAEGSGANIEISDINIQEGRQVNLLSGQLMHG